MESQFDVLIVFHTTAVTQDGPAQGIVQTGDVFKIDEEASSLARIIEIGWCSFDMRRQVVIDECQIFVKPSNAFILTPEQIAYTGVTQENLSRGFSLTDALSKFNDHCYYNYTSHNKSFCLATVGEEILTRILPGEVRTMGIKLPQQFFSFFDIRHEFKRFYPQSDSVVTAQDMINYLGLKPIEFDNQCQLQTKSLVRILNKLVRDKHIFLSPKLLNQRYELIRAARDDSGMKKNNAYKRWSGFIRGRSPEPYKVMKDFYIRLRGLPAECDFEDVKLFMKAVRVFKRNLAFIYDSFGTFTGEAIVKMCNEMDFREALSYHLGESKDKVVEVYESTKKDYLKARGSSNPQTESSPDLLPLIPEGAKVMLLKGLSPKLNMADLHGLLKGIRVVENGLLRGYFEGSPSDEALVVVGTAGDATNLMKLESLKIPGSELKAEERDRKFMADFLRTNFVRNPGLMRSRLPPVTLERRTRTLAMYGLPKDLTFPELLNLFRNDKIVDKELLMIPEENGGFSGTALVTFQEEQDARRALKTKNLIYLRNRYVELNELR